MSIRTEDNKIRPRVHSGMELAPLRTEATSLSCPHCHEEDIDGPNLMLDIDGSCPEVAHKVFCGVCNEWFTPEEAAEKDPARADRWREIGRWIAACPVAS